MKHGSSSHGTNFGGQRGLQRVYKFIIIYKFFLSYRENCQLPICLLRVLPICLCTYFPYQSRNEKKPKTKIFNISLFMKIFFFQSTVKPFFPTVKYYSNKSNRKWVLAVYVLCRIPNSNFRNYYVSTSVHRWSRGGFLSDSYFLSDLSS